MLQDPIPFELQTPGASFLILSNGDFLEISHVASKIGAGHGMTRMMLLGADLFRINRGNRRHCGRASNGV